MLSLAINQKQNLKISPQLQYSNHILQLSNLELIHEIQNNLSENPFLEEKGINEHFKIQKINYDNQNLKKNISYNKDEYNIFQNIASKDKSLIDDLNKQLILFNLSCYEYEIAQSIISSLDPKGYFNHHLEHWISEKNYDFNLSLKILKIIQKLEPKGIAGQNLKEVLLLQINPQDHLIVQIIKNHLHEIGLKKIFPQLAKKYSVSVLEIQKAIKNISHLNPIPASQYDLANHNNHFIIPDLKIEKKNKQFVITLFEPYPKFNINETYWNIFQKNNSQNASYNNKDGLKEQFQKAKLINYSIQKRKATILKVVKHIILHQKDFFEKGPDFLNPLSIKDISYDLNLHPSTISRVITHKHVETSWGLFSLKIFFERGLSQYNGEKTSISKIKNMIQHIILSNKQKKLSDQKISDILKSKNIQIARRTVAKYRKSLFCNKLL